MAPCEVVVIGDLFGVRLTGTEPLGETVAVPGTRDDLAELLPTEVVLGSIEVSPAELRGVGRNTIISLGQPDLGGRGRRSCGQAGCRSPEARSW